MIESWGQVTQNQVYAVFAPMCQNQGCDPNQTFLVSYQLAKMVYNVTLNGSTLDTTNLDGYWQDPFTFLHKGDDSYYSGYFFDTPHLIDGGSLSGHIDPFGPLNPLHYLIQLPAMLFPAGPSGVGMCSLAGGCTLGQ